ncbi:MAG: tetratricopeptide repeat protein [Candidatus Omnitrophica bacterium]|nr:tetratricopeptide repeat protein [Candidatus Omnitrophota bacterium]MCK5180830.1 tetratricopeptide repeat protein [Candidatus Omnitrophota bacterium]
MPERGPRLFSGPSGSVGVKVEIQYCPVQRRAVRGSSQRRERVERAIPLFEKAIEINPYYYKAHYFLGMSFLKIGRKGEAKARLLRLIELDPSGEWANNARRILGQF